MLQIQRQFITDNEGELVGVILPIAEYRLIENFLQATPFSTSSTESKLQLLKQAATDPLFLADLEETMSAFADIDEEWWETSE